MKTISAKARVQITVEITGGSGWADNCSIAQLYDQAAESARRTLLNILKPGEHRNITIIGEPKVVGIITEEAKP